MSNEKAPETHTEGERLIIQWWNANNAPRIDEADGPLNGISAELAVMVDDALAAGRRDEREQCVREVRQIATEYENVRQANTGSAIAGQTAQYIARHLEAASKESTQ